MITPKAFGLIIKHFDEIDKIVSARTLRKRPWLEVALTSLLCDLLDNDTQEEEKLNYTIKDLQNDLLQEDSLFGIELSIEAIEYNSTYERYISQSDIALNIVYDDKIDYKNSWEKPYLLQAKRVMPKKLNPVFYNEASTFGSIDKEQEKRIELLNKILGANYLKYLFFCPRPDNLDNETKIKLSYLRTTALSSQIFDYTTGLELHKELMKNSETLKAGMFITDTNNKTLNLGQVHRGTLQSTFPFSWFIAMNFTNNNNFNNRQDKMMKDDNENDKFVKGIIEGDKKSIEELIKKIGENEKNEIPSNIQILPKHRLTVKYIVGEQINPDRRNIRQE